MRGTRTVAVGVGVVILLGALAPGASALCLNEPAKGFYDGGDGELWVLVSQTEREDTQRLFRATRGGETGVEVTPGVTDVTTGGGPRSFHDVHRGQDGKWYVLTADGVSVWESDRRGLVRQIPLTHEGEANLTVDGGLAQDRSGRWWVVTNGQLRRYTADWNRTGSAALSATAVTTSDDRIWVLQFDGTIARVQSLENGGSLATVGSVDWETEGVDLARTDGGFWSVLDDDGTVHRYTPYGQYTGHATDLAVPADAECYDDLGRLTDLMLGLLIWGVVPLLVVAFARPGRWPEVGATIALSLPISSAFREFWLEWPFAVVYWMPDPAIAGTLTLAGVALLSRLRSDVPLLVLSALYLGPLALVAVRYSWPAVALVAAGSAAVYALRRRSRPPREA